MESHPAPAGTRLTRCVARMGPVPRSRCPRSIGGGDITASGLISRPAAVSRFLSNLCAGGSSALAAGQEERPAGLLCGAAAPACLALVSPGSGTPKIPARASRGAPSSPHHASLGMPVAGPFPACATRNTNRSQRNHCAGAAGTPRCPSSLTLPHTGGQELSHSPVLGAEQCQGRSLCHHHPGHFGPHPGLRCHPAFPGLPARLWVLRQQLLTPTQGWLKITPGRAAAWILRRNIRGMPGMRDEAPSRRGRVFTPAPRGLGCQWALPHQGSTQG